MLWNLTSKSPSLGESSSAALLEEVSGGLQCLFCWDSPVLVDSCMLKTAAGSSRVTVSDPSKRSPLCTRPKKLQFLIVSVVIDFIPLYKLDYSLHKRDSSLPRTTERFIKLNFYFVPSLLSPHPKSVKCLKLVLLKYVGRKNETIGERCKSTVRLGI